MKIILLTIISISLIPFVFAEDDSGVFDWRFCEERFSFPYDIINGTLKDAIHFKLHDAIECDDRHSTNYQLQLIHTSNNQTSFKMTVPDDLEYDQIKLRIVDRYDVDTFWLNGTSNTIEFKNYIHDKFGEIFIILDFSIK